MICSTKWNAVVSYNCNVTDLPLDSMQYCSAAVSLALLYSYAYSFFLPIHFVIIKKQLKNKLLKDFEVQMEYCSPGESQF